MSRKQYWYLPTSWLCPIVCLVGVISVIYGQSSSGRGQIAPKITATTTTTKATTAPSQIYLEKSDKLIFDQERSPDYQLLLGNVCFRHDSTYLYCDSAYFYSKENSLDAFSNVKILQGDTLSIFGDELYYKGNTKIAKLRYNVEMINRGMTLFTDSFNYHRIENIGYFFEGGLMINGDNELSSLYGEYKPDTKMAYFTDDVKLTDPDFILYSDTLHYNTNTKIANLQGPSRILSDDNLIYTERGWYNTKTEKSLLLDNSYIENKSQKLKGDSILYDRYEGVGQAYGNVVITDTLNKVILKGRKGKHFEKLSRSFVTDSALCIEHSGVDSLFLHADTLFMEKDTTRYLLPSITTTPQVVIDSTSSIGKDSLAPTMAVDTTDYKLIKAYHKARFWRVDLQGVSDSIVYVSRDSILQMTRSPIVWSDNYQMSGEQINIFVKDSTADRVEARGGAMSIEQLDSVAFNQLSGKVIVGYIKDKELYKVTVDGNAESIYYPYDSDSTLVGLNNTKSSYMTIYMQNKKVDKIVLTPESQGSLTPESLIKQDQRKLSGFFWEVNLRPGSKEDIFTEVKQEHQAVTPQRRRRKQP